MKKLEKPIGAEDAQRAAKRFILARGSNASIAFHKVALRKSGRGQVYELEGYCRFTKWPASTGRKSLFKIVVDAHSRSIVGCYEV